MSEQDLKYLDGKFEKQEEKINNRIDKIENKIDKFCEIMINHKTENAVCIKELEKKDIEVDLRVSIIEKFNNKKTTIITTVATGSAMIIINILILNLIK